MKKNNVDKVRDFLTAFGQPVQDRPGAFDEDKVVLALNLLVEEVAELIVEFPVEIVDRIIAKMDESSPVNSERRKHLHYPNVLKELVDVEVVLHNLTNFLGLNQHYQAGFDAVAEENMRKRCRDTDHAKITEAYYKRKGIKVRVGTDMIVRRLDGKIMKPVEFEKFDPETLFTDKSIMANWQCTDPDTHQYAFKEGERVWTYRQWDQKWTPQEGEIERQWNNPSFWIEETISLSDYGLETAWPYVEGFYPAEEFGKMWGRRDEWKADGSQIVCECIFESKYL